MANSNSSERMRSPRYPSHSLPDALAYARKIYGAVHRSPVDSGTAVQVMGFSGKSGASASALGSVRQYGLIEGVGENTRISALGLGIFEPESTAEYGQKLRVSAFSPHVFGAISERFSGKIPSVDEPIRSFLIRDLGFSKSGAADCISSMRATLDFITEHAGDSVADSVGSSSAAENLSNPTTAEPALDKTIGVSASIDSGAVTQVRLPLTRDCYAEVTLYGEINAKALENLRRQVEFLTEVWAED